MLRCHPLLITDRPTLTHIRANADGPSHPKPSHQRTDLPRLRLSGSACIGPLRVASRDIASSIGDTLNSGRSFIECLAIPVCAPRPAPALLDVVCLLLGLSQRRLDFDRAGGGVVVVPSTSQRTVLCNRRATGPPSAAVAVNVSVGAGARNRWAPARTVETNGRWAAFIWLCLTNAANASSEREGRLAQRESARFTRERSLVRSQYRPPPTATCSACWRNGTHNSRAWRPRLSRRSPLVRATSVQRQPQSPLARRRVASPDRRLRRPVDTPMGDSVPCDLTR